MSCTPSIYLALWEGEGEEGGGGEGEGGGKR